MVEVLFMLVQMLDKQRRAVCVVKTALLNAGIRNRPICVQVQNWSFAFGNSNHFSVFIAAQEGSNVEPFYSTGNSIAEAVKHTLDVIKGKHGTNTVDQTEVAPF